MPNILFFRGEPHNRLYGYYLDGAAEIVVEFLQPGCEDHVYRVKQPIYAATGVPELWILDGEQQRIECLQLVEGTYEVRSPDATGRYAVSSVPGLTFLSDKLWVDEREWDNPFEQIWFEVAEDIPEIVPIQPISEGVDWSKALLKFPIALAPVAIDFEDYIYWCPPARFEFVRGRPDIGGSEGIKRLAGMLMMTFGLAEVVKLAHPSEWVSALLALRAKAVDPNHKAATWKLVHDIARFLRDHYEIERIVVAGDLVGVEPLTFWSELVLFVWGLQQSENPQSDPFHYPSPQILVRQLSESPQIRLVDASKELTAIEQECLQAGSVEL